MPIDRSGRSRGLGAVLVALVLVTGVQPAEAARYRGRPLAAALLDLRALGLKIVYTNRVVGPELVVLDEPTATRPRDLLDQLLAPHGLRAQDGPRGTIVILQSPRAPNSAAQTAARPRDHSEISGAASEAVDGSAPPTSVFSDQLLVTPSRFTLLADSAALGISREEIHALPHLGDDFFRAITLLPGATTNDTSAQFHLRGGRRDEVRYVLDGQELYDPFHLQDYDRALSFVSPATLGGADLETGGFSVEHGDRMSGVLDLTTVRAEAEPRLRVTLGVLNAQIGAAGRWGGDSSERIHGGWLVEGRRGSIDLVGRLLGREDPQYWDSFAKIDLRLGSRHGLSARLLRAEDQLTVSQQVPGETDKRFSTEYSSSYAWLTHEVILGSDVLLETSASWTHLDRDRRGAELEENTRFRIDDRRDLSVGELRQHGDAQASEAHLLSWGVELRRFDAEYDYRGRREFDNPLAQLRHDFGREATDFKTDLDSRHQGYFLTDRWRVNARTTVELGARLDAYTLTDERRVSPRASVAFALGAESLVRLAWGRFEQSQRPNELQVEDGDTTFHEVERGEHRVIGLERLFTSRGGSQGTTVRVEVYERLVSNPRPRYENLFEPLNTFPEVEPDRIVVAPERSRARGIELFVRGSLGEHLGGWASYTLASSDDRLQGRWVPRAFDETHALKVDLDWVLGPRWRANFAGRFHSGWPTTEVRLLARLDEEGEIEYVPVLGRFQSERLTPYHRFDVRVSRRSTWRSARVDLFLDVQNLYDRKNLGGFDLEIDEDHGRLIKRPERGAGILPSIGIRFEI